MLKLSQHADDKNCFEENFLPAQKNKMRARRGLTTIVYNNKNGEKMIKTY